MPEPSCAGSVFDAFLWVGRGTAWLEWRRFTLPSAAALVLFAYGAGALSGSIGTGLLHGLKLTPVAIVAQALWGMFALSWLQAFRFEHGSCGRAFQEQDERLRSLGCVAVGADTRGEFRHLCELSWQWPY